MIEDKRMLFIDWNRVLPADVFVVLEAAYVRDTIYKVDCLVRNFYNSDIFSNIQVRNI